RRDAHTAATVAALVDAARTRFGRDGYDQVGVEQVAADAGVTTGAVYHHFAGKKGLFLAAAEQVEAELLARAVAVADPDPLTAIRHAFAALVDAGATPEIHRILFIDAPRVIGIEAWRAIEMKYAYGLLSGVLAELMAAGRIVPRPLELVAPTLLAVLAEASRAVAACIAGRAAAQALVAAVVDAVLAPPA
ncbi:MAG: TetR/AcrR family transcriptional regulator, partial [Sphingomonadaceae bacterium]|nr:TetR/AcrR family transcriptional regulator [Sphingomonadaceae bacterium]